MNKLKLSIFSILMLVGFISHAQEVRVKASVDSTNVLIGDQLHLTFELEQPKNIKVTLPQLRDSITSGIEISKLSPIDTIAMDDDEMLKIVQSLTIQAFDTGLQTIPAQEFIIKLDTTEHILASNTAQFYVHPGFKVDTSIGPADIKAPYEAPINLAEASPYILGILLLAAIIFFIFYYINYRAKKKAGIVDEKPKEPAHITALRSLDKIKEEELWKDESMTKEYFSEVSDVLRTYIENRFSINALELTTIETMDAFKSRKVLSDPKLVEHLKKILELSDLVKFAKFKPLPQDGEGVLNLTFSFIKDTMMLESEAPKENDDNPEEDNNPPQQSNEEAYMPSGADSKPKDESTF